MKSQVKICALIFIVGFIFSGQNLFSQVLAKNDSKTSTDMQEFVIPDKSENESVSFAESEVRKSLFPINQGLSPKINTKSLQFQIFDNSLVNHNESFSRIFKYDTSPDNPDHRCYEIVAPLTKNYQLHFNFMSQENFTLGNSR